MDEQGKVAPDRQVGRFTLDDLMEERHGCQIWRAVDSTLNREVALWLVPEDAALTADLKQSTRTAATVADRRIVRTLDVFTAEDLLVIVTEWNAAEVLGDHVTSPMAPEEAARIAYEVSGAIESAHAQGIAHGRLRPSNILVGHDGEVRITGLGIDAVLAGIEPVAGDDPVAADINGIGSILYLGLTGRWPDGDVEGIPGAPEVGGHTLPPSRILADLPDSLDDFCARTVIGVETPRGRPRLASATQAREALGASLTDLAGDRRVLAGTPPEKSSNRPRVAVVLGVLLLLLGLAWGAWRILSADTQVPGIVEPTPETSQAPAPIASGAPQAVTYRVVDGIDFDPLGNGEENPGRVPFAFDEDSNTAWRTVTYYNKSLDKPGVGLVLDLGAARTIGAVTLDLVGNGSDLQVLTSNDPGPNPQDYDLMAQATEAGDKVRLKAADPTSARFILVWFTGLPQVDGGWRGGIREVQVSS